MSGRARRLDCVWLRIAAAGPVGERHRLWAPGVDRVAWLPVGAVGLGETVRDAAMRLLGDLPAGVALELDAAGEWALPDEFRALLRASKLFAAPAADADGTGHLLARGSIVRLLASGASFAHVASAADDLGAPRPVPAGANGFVRRSLLAAHLGLHRATIRLAADPAWEPAWPGPWADASTTPDLPPWQAGWAAAFHRDPSERPG